MVIDVTEQQASLGLVDDQPDVAADANRPEVLVFGLFEFVKTHPGIRRIELQVERGRLDGLLLFASQSYETVGKGVCDTEFHSTGSRVSLQGQTTGGTRVWPGS